MKIVVDTNVVVSGVFFGGAPFIACAVAGRCPLVVSGDRDLLDVGGYRGVDIVTPRAFLESLS